MHSCHLLFDHFQFTLIHGPKIPGSYAILFTALEFISIANHIQNLVFYLVLAQPLHSFWSCFSLFYSNILGTFRPGEFIFQCHIFLPFHTLHGVLKARILKWFATPFSSGLHFVRTLHLDPSTLVDPTLHGS